MKCKNCGKKFKSEIDISYVASKGGYICNKCYDDTQKSKESVMTKMMAYHSGRICVQNQK